jgi:hypothetical protein
VNGVYLKISYEANILTLITLVMSVGSLAWQTVNYLKGAETRLIPPEQVVIADSGAAKFPNRDGGPYVHFIARMSYVNAGAAGYNATIRAERVRVTVSGRQFEQNWFRYVHSDADSTEATKLVVDKVSEARPLPLTAGSAESHETLFFSLGKRNAQAHYRNAIGVRITLIGRPSSNGLHQAGSSNSSF